MKNKNDLALEYLKKQNLLIALFEDNEFVKYTKLICVR